jgi:hypothetical protein
MPMSKFWTDDPKLLLSMDFNIEKMSTIEKLNAISRIIIFITVFSFFISYNRRHTFFTDT